MWTNNFSIVMNSSPAQGEIVVLFSGQERTKPNHHVGPKVHDNFLVHYVMSGRGWCRAGDTRQALEQGDAFFIFPNEIAEYCSDADEPWHYCWIGFRGDLAAWWMERLGVTIEQPVIRTRERGPYTGLFRAVFRALSVVGAAGNERAGAYFRLLLAEWLLDHPAHVEPMEQLSIAQRQIDKAVRYFALQYARDISITEVARELGYHRTHFSKIFRQLIGFSPQSYLLQIRMHKAAELLKQPLTIEQVASSVGFSDPLYFSRQFKKMYKKSPSNYRDHI
jgi:AraC-like DNA-binding protein